MDEATAGVRHPYSQATDNPRKLFQYRLKMSLYGIGPLDMLALTNRVDSTILALKHSSTSGNTHPSPNEMRHTARRWFSPQMYRSTHGTRVATTKPMSIAVFVARANSRCCVPFLMPGSSVFSEQATDPAGYLRAGEWSAFGRRRQVAQCRDLLSSDSDSCQAAVGNESLEHRRGRAVDAVGAGLEGGEDDDDHSGQDHPNLAPRAVDEVTEREHPDDDANKVHGGEQGRVVVLSGGRRWSGWRTRRGQQHAWAAAGQRADDWANGGLLTFAYSSGYKRERIVLISPVDPLRYPSENRAVPEARTIAT